MAILNLEYYTQKDLYSDGDIEEQMLKMAKEGVTCEELSSEQVSFPVIYHFSDLRANILNWYPIKKSDSVLIRNDCQITYIIQPVEYGKIAIPVTGTS